MSELKPCPFCGGKARRYITANGFVHVYCPRNNLCMVHPTTEWLPKQSQADSAWNTRITRKEEVPQ